MADEALEALVKRVGFRMMEPAMDQYLADVIKAAIAEPELLRAALAEADFLPEHYVEITNNDWAISHSFRCREVGMLDCLFHEAMMVWHEPPVPVGRYLLSFEEDGELFFAPVGKDT